MTAHARAGGRPFTGRATRRVAAIPVCLIPVCALAVPGAPLPAGAADTGRRDAATAPRHAVRVASARQRDTTVQSALVTGVVRDSLRGGAPAAGAVVSVPGQPHSTITDAHGRFRLHTVRPGRVALVVETPLLDSLGVGAPPRWVVLAAGDSVDVALATPSAATIRRVACGTDDPDGRMVVGTVRDAATARPIAGARVRASWVDVLVDRRRGVQARTLAVEAHSGDDGAYLLCGLPGSGRARIALGATMPLARDRNGDQGARPPDVLAPPAAPADAADEARTGLVELPVPAGDRGGDVVIQTLLLAASAPGAGVRAPLDGAPVPPASATTQPASPGQGGADAAAAGLTGVVTAPDGTPIVGARVRLVGSETIARTDSAGRYRLVGLPAGTQSLHVLHLGARPTTLAVELVPGTVATRDVTLPRADARALAPVRVTGRRADRARAEVARLRPRSDVFLDRDAYQAARGAALLDPLFRLSGAVPVAIDGGGQFPVLAPGGEKRAGRCIPLVVVDGRPLDLPEIGAVDPADVEQMAVFRSLWTVPAEYATLRRTREYDRSGLPMIRLGEGERQATQHTTDRTSDGIRYGPACGAVVVTTRPAGAPPP